MDHDNDQVKGPAEEEGKDKDVTIDEDLDGQKVKQQDLDRDSASLDASLNLESNTTGEIDATAADGSYNKMDSTEQVSVPETTDTQVIGDVFSGWKLVMHEESNQYYYWNIETGETSWEVPDILSQGPGLSHEQKTFPVIQGTDSASHSLGTHEPSSTLVEVGNSSDAHTVDGSAGSSLISVTKEMYEYGHEIDERNGVCDGQSLEAKSQDPEFDQSEIKNASGDLCHEISSSEHYLSAQKSGDVTLANGSGSNQYMHGKVANEEYGTRADISSDLIKHGECLLERLKSLKGFEGHLQGHDWTSKYILEIEIRLSDIRALVSYGSSLCPFWEHSERRLKQLECVITDEIGVRKMNDAEARDISVIREDKLLESTGDENEADGIEKGVVFPLEDSVCPNIGQKSVVENNSHDEVPTDFVVNAEYVTSSGYPIATWKGTAEESCEKINDGAALPGELAPKSGQIYGEDMDMDVDMEVEDATPTSNIAIGDALNGTHFVIPEQSIQPNPSAGYPFLATEDGSIVPPPPDEEWIPPPPPDNELVPPPPPDEPPEPSPPPPSSYPEAVQPVPYTGQYSLTYPDSNFGFYGHTVAEIPSANLYGHIDGPHVAVPPQPIYYEVVPNTYADTTPVLVNPTDTTAYYDIKDGTLPPIPVVVGAESSGFHVASALASYSSLVTEQIGSNDIHADVGSSSLLNMRVDVAAVGSDTGVASSDIPVTSTSAQALATSSVKESVPVPSTTAVTSATVVSVTSATAKVQSKVMRSKKRTIAVAPTLRSNKKVSSLVDKWKAAKEELQEDDEDEPENAFEILEKKRQREIEEWRAKQIASGEAKDNANFQPLGGDWRERVKRRRAARGAVQTSLEVVADGGNQQPNLMDLSRDLAPGWQAYWDESSKQVYYGNAATSETTWTRPAK
ncbi:uncharacterized protein LOC131167901 isoform X2 [Malania oleifera]|nr:uncharacterized protein LOC131167901 isoform X2 [Malania oleifera]